MREGHRSQRSRVLRKNTWKMQPHHLLVFSLLGIPPSHLGNGNNNIHLMQGFFWFLLCVFFVFSPQESKTAQGKPLARGLVYCKHLVNGSSSPPHLPRKPS